MAEWLVILTALIAALPGVYAVVSGRRKSRAEAADTISDAAVQLVEPLKCENVALRAQVAALRAELDALRTEVETLRTDNATLRTEVTQLRSDNETLRLAIAALRQRNTELEQGVEALAQQVEALGAAPVYKAQPKKR